MPGIKQELSYLMLGQQGGENRIKILEHLKDRGYNLNQLSNELDLNYRTIKHHIDILLEYDMIESSGEGYGEVYFLTSKLEENYEMLEEMKSKIQTVFKSPKLFEKVVEQTHEGIIVLDENKDIIFLNKSAQEITGYQDKDLLGKHIEELVESDINQSLEQVLKKEEFFEETIKIQTKSEGKKTVVITMDYFHLNGEEHEGFSLLMRDVTKERKQREILDALMDHSEVMMAYLDTDFDLVYVNSAYAEKTDHSPEELVGKNHFDLFPNEGNKDIFEEVIEEEKDVSIEDKSLLYPDSSEKEDTYWTLETVTDGGEEIQGLVLSFCEHP